VKLLARDEQPRRDISFKCNGVARSEIHGIHIICSPLGYHGDVHLGSVSLTATVSMAFVALWNADGVEISPLSCTCTDENEATREASETDTKIHSIAWQRLYSWHSDVVFNGRKRSYDCVLYQEVLWCFLAPLWLILIIE
jgi:hypothetical protein